jgi:nitrate/TMAO reductase-like tetraheme cytochrome c subunit
MTTNETKHTGLYRNWVSYFGALVSAGSILLIVFALALDVSVKRPSPYIGIFTYMVFPTFFAVGAVLFLYGMRRESIRRRREGTDEALAYPRVDLNDPGQRKWFSYIVLGGTFLAILMTFVTYNAFLYSESVSFCGTLCHSVMKPEYEAYKASPHARVSCVDCHVGHGASWYVKAKVSGARQVLAVLFKSYPTPIPTPIENLRPARETCEECHWPAKFFGTQLMQIPHFRYDERNTPEQISIGVKTGGGSEALGGTAGIHWHMIIQNKVQYVALDRQKQEIPWFEVRHADGRVDEYMSLDYKGTKEQLAALPRDDMDCMDCHNRPTHTFDPPEAAVDRAMSTGAIPRTLPWVKKVVVDALVREYPTREKANEEMRAEIAGFYEKRYPGVSGKRSGDVEKTVGAAVAIYNRSIFPEMKVNWKTYPSNIGHRNWPGCFRCHDGRHVSKAGKVLSMECAVCHTRPVRSPLMPLGTVVTGSRMPWHPVELAGKHGRVLCNRCHAAGYRPPSDCAECHRIDTAAPMMSSMKCAECHTKGFEARPVAECKDCHDGISGLHIKGEHKGLSCAECHKPHRWAVTGRETCLACHSDMKDHNKDGGACMKCHAFRGRKM